MADTSTTKLERDRERNTDGMQYEKVSIAALSLVPPSGFLNPQQDSSCSIRYALGADPERRYTPKKELHAKKRAASPFVPLTTKGRRKMFDAAAAPASVRQEYWDWSCVSVTDRSGELRTQTYLDLILGLTSCLAHIRRKMPRISILQIHWNDPTTTNAATV